MVAKPNKSLFHAILIAGAMCILFVAAIDFIGGQQERHPPGPWDGDLCFKISGGTADYDGNGSAHSEEEILRDVVEVDVAEGSIFFLETACSKDLTPRQACAVESAARANPETQVYVLLTSLVISVGRFGNDGYARLLSLSYPNVRIHRLHLGTFSRGTPMEGWVIDGSLAGSEWIVHHASDAMRLLTLWRYGGTYLDLDVILMKPLTGMRNFAGAEGAEDVANGVINLDGPGRAGHALADAFVREFVSEFRGDEWSHNGPGVLTRVLSRLCNVSAGEEGGWSGCPHDFKVYPPPAFYPIPWRQWRRYFNESVSAETMLAVGNAMAAHVWNRESSGAEVRVGSRQPYGLLAAQFCPVVYRSCGEIFGTSLSEVCRTRKLAESATGVPG